MKNIIIIVLVITNIVFITLWLRTDSKLASALNATESSRATSAFLSLFVDKVLMAKEEISFEDRLKLENDVRALKNESIFKEWTKFIESKTSEAAQLNIKSFIAVLVKSLNF